MEIAFGDEFLRESTRSVILQKSPRRKHFKSPKKKQKQKETEILSKEIPKFEVEFKENRYFEENQPDLHSHYEEKQENYEDYVFTPANESVCHDKKVFTFDEFDVKSENDEISEFKKEKDAEMIENESEKSLEIIDGIRFHPGHFSDTFDSEFSIKY